MHHEREGAREAPPGRLPSLLLVIAFALLSGCVSRYLVPGASQYRRGMDAAAKGDYESALRSYDSAIEANPKEPVYYLNRGAAFFAQRNYDRAIADFDHALSLKPDYAAAFVDRGNAYLSKGDNDRAILDYDHAIILMPALYPAIFNRGNAYYAKRDYSHAIRDYRQALALNPNPPNYLFALDRNQRISWRKQDSAEALNKRCWIRALTGEELETALSECEESLNLLPNSPATLDSRALVHLRMGHFERAISDADAALEWSSKNASSLFVRGLAKRRLGDALGADRDLEDARAIDPKVDDLYVSIGVAP
jgi:tetratricopeptide (TPR) repeat protein